MNTITDFLRIALGLAADLWTVWSPFVFLILAVVAVVTLGTKMVTTARSNAAVRAARAARMAYRAPVVDLFTRQALPSIDGPRNHIA
jgi:ABC-type siderophore export system fused ATPase/permease subunit